MPLIISNNKKLVKESKPAKTYIEETCTCGEQIRLEAEAVPVGSSYTCGTCGEVWNIEAK